MNAVVIELAGGVLIGLSALLLMLTLGRVAGISGIDVAPTCQSTSVDGGSVRTRCFRSRGNVYLWCVPSVTTTRSPLVLRGASSATSAPHPQPPDRQRRATHAE